MILTTREGGRYWADRRAALRDQAAPAVARRAIEDNREGCEERCELDP